MHVRQLAKRSAFYIERMGFGFFSRCIKQVFHKADQGGVSLPNG